MSAREQSWAHVIILVAMIAAFTVLFWAVLHGPGYC